MTTHQAAEAFGIGVRFDPSTPGYGLGLAIARDIASVYGIALTLSGRCDQLPGLTARLQFPVAR